MATTDIRYNDDGEKLQPRHIIKCPHCNWEYLPSEIFLPNSVIGYPAKEIRDPLGKIIYEEYKVGKDPIAEEKFFCENCNKPFITELDIKYTTRAEEDSLDFTETSAKLW